jgi:phosphohistidine phosphatase
MKRLYLIRHAKSSKDLIGIKDRDRPLNRRGERQAKYIGKLLEKRAITPGALYSSPAKRALDTARAIGKRIGFSRKKIKVVNAIYYSNVLKLIKVIKKMDERVDSAALFGHNPEFLNLVNYLTPRPVKEFPTCAVFGIDLKIGSWKKVARKACKISFFAAPPKDI